MGARSDDATCCMMTFVIFGVVFLIVATLTMLGGYTPLRVYNDRMIYVNCSQTHTIKSDFCHVKGLLVECYYAFNTLKVVDTDPGCERTLFLGVFGVESAAQHYLDLYSIAGYDNCLMDPQDTCNPRHEYYDANTSLFVAIGFYAAAAVMGIFAVWGALMPGNRNIG